MVPPCLAQWPQPHPSVEQGCKQRSPHSQHVGALTSGVAATYRCDEAAAFRWALVSSPCSSRKQATRSEAGLHPAAAAALAPWPASRRWPTRSALAELGASGGDDIAGAGSASRAWSALAELGASGGDDIAGAGSASRAWSALAELGASGGDDIAGAGSASGGWSALAELGASGGASRAHVMTMPRPFSLQGATDQENSGWLSTNVRSWLRSSNLFSCE
jgi:hypothetical protein